MFTNKIYQFIKKNAVQGKPLLSILIDPGKLSEKTLLDLIKQANTQSVDLFMVGGSLISEPVDSIINLIKKHSTIPTVIFPGNLLHLSASADAILLLSLISGRNPDLLIGQHVQAAPFLKKHKVETIATAYILVGDYQNSSVAYMSNTRPIPYEKEDLIIATAIAGELTGNQLIYLEGGSGTKHAIPASVIKKVKKNITIPLIIGGGITSRIEVENAYKAGADIVIVGNALEKNTDLELLM